MGAKPQLDWNAVWARIDAPHIARSSHAIVARMDGWRESVGVAHEIFEFGKRGKPVFSLDPQTLAMEIMRFSMEGAE